MMYAMNCGRDLRVAAAQGRLDEVKELLRDPKTSVDAVDCWGRTALYRAVRSGHLHVVLELLAAGADVNVVTGVDKKYFKMSDEDRDAIFGRGSSVEDIDTAKDYDSEVDTPLHAAVELDPPNVDLVKALLAARADVNKPAKSWARRSDRTPLTWAVLCSDFDVVQELLAAGARPNYSTVLGAADDARMLEAVVKKIKSGGPQLKETVSLRELGEVLELVLAWKSNKRMMNDVDRMVKRMRLTL